MRRIGVCLAVVGLSGCASSPASITPTYVNPGEFSGLSCETMATEYATLSENLDETIGRQQANADADTALTAGGMILLWPLLIGLAFTPDEEEEISLMMGQAEALEASMEAADCPVQVVDPEETVVVDGQEVLVEEEQPVLVDGREPVGLFEGTPYEPDDQGQADGELEPDS